MGQPDSGERPAAPSVPEQSGDDGAAPVASGDGPPSWLRRAAIVVGAVLGVAGLIALGVVLLPGWWADLVGGWVAGVRGRGIPIGLGVGALFTVAPLVVVLLALRSGLRPRTRVVLGVVALLLTLPNVLTAAIAASPSDARSVLAIAAPGFRGASAVGVGVTVLLVAGVLVVRWWGRRTRRTVAQARDHAIELGRERTSADAGGARPSVVDPDRPGRDPDRPAAVHPGDSAAVDPDAGPGHDPDRPRLPEPDDHDLGRDT